MTGLARALRTAENYRRFAVDEAAGRSATYEQLALAVAGNDVVLSFLEPLPVSQRQPNLLFAAARYVLGSPAEHTSLRSLVSEQPDELAEITRTATFGATPKKGAHERVAALAEQEPTRRLMINGRSDVPSSTLPSRTRKQPGHRKGG
jgi:hypothetical protein